MNDRIEGCRHLAQLIETQILAASELLGVLTEEKRALTGSSVEVLQEIDTRKRALLARTEQMEQARRKFCHTLGVGAERGAMDFLINDLAAAGHEGLQATLRTSWQRLKELVLQCRDVNEINGSIAQFKQRQLLQLLGLLRGGGGNHLTYQASGAAANVLTPSRAIAEA